MVPVLKKKIFVIATCILLIDQLVKHIIISNLSYGKEIFMIPKFLYLTHVKNTGGAWSIFQENPSVLFLVGIVSLGILFYYLYQKNYFSKFEIVYLGIIIGGILGNFIDRICQNGVIDYIGLIFGKYHFPIFNIADIAIVCGAFLLIIDSLRGDIHGIRSNKG